MLAEPHKIKTIRMLDINTFQQRNVILREAFYNTFNIQSNHVMYDMTSQGTSAKSQEQESGSLVGDETYAGSRNFEKLCDVVLKTFGHPNVCPTHNLKGSIKLVSTTIVKPGSTVFANSNFPKYLVEDLKGNFEKIESNGDEKYLGNIDLQQLNEKVAAEKFVPYIYIDCYSCGFKAVSFDQIKEIKKIAEKYKTKLVLNVSQLVELAYYIRENEKQFNEKKLAEIVYNYAKTADVIILDASQDPRCNIGGLIGALDYNVYEKYMNEVVVYEGLHTYGGMAGRTMEIFARGIEEMIYEPQAEWIATQVKYLAEITKDIPKFVGADGIYIIADEFLSQIRENQAFAVAAMLYLKAGIRCFIDGKFNKNNILPVQIPRLGFSKDQLKHIGEAINEVYKERNNLTFFNLTNKPQWADQAKFVWSEPYLTRFEYKCEAYRIATIEYIGVATREERERIIKEVGYNTFLLPSKDVGIDFLTDSGTCAQTTTQWSKYNDGQETQASSKDYFDLVKELQEITGYKYIIPTHQGRAAEHIMSQCLIKKGDCVPGNMYFTTTKLHQEIAGGIFADVICDEAHDPTCTFEWKGNIDLNKVQKLIDQYGADNIPYISFEFSVNLAGGQPVSMDNAREVFYFCKKHGIPIMFDATRAVENAYMIKKKDPKYKHLSIREILRELFSYGDGCTVSSKKDYLVNIGGFLAIRDDADFYDKAMSLLRIYEGSSTNGGMSASDLAVHAEGVREMIDFNYISARVEQTQYLGNKLKEAGIPIVDPIGTHAVFLDAKRFLPHIKQDNYPAQALASALFLESGIRAMERGIVSSGRDKKTGQNYHPKLELVRLTIPRRAYTNAHMDLVAEAIISLYKKRETIRPLEFVYEPENLRFFQGKFKEL
jgi:tyrosine phenol-lyase